MEALGPSDGHLPVERYPALICDIVYCQLDVLNSFLRAWNWAMEGCEAMLTPRKIQAEVLESRGQVSELP